MNILHISQLDIWVRALFLLVIGISVSILSEQISKKEISLKESERRLKNFNIELEQKVAKRTKELKKSEEKYHEAYNRLSFYKDLFTHDMNNILHNIQLSIELLSLDQKEPRKEKKTDKFIHIVKKQADRGARLIQNIRTLSEIEEIEITLKPIDVYDISEKAKEYIIKSFQDRKINVQIDSSSKKFYPKANELLQDVFENILINAVKHNDNPSVEIIVKISKYQKNSINDLKLEFIDNGRGIPDEMKDKIFEKYKTDSRSTGMGLGLSLVKKIIEKYNGHIWVEDKIQGDYKKGSNFVILIPLA